LPLHRARHRHAARAGAQARPEEAQALLALAPKVFPGALGYFPTPQDYRIGSARYLNLLHRAREAADIPVSASLNGATESGLAEAARDRAGSDQGDG
jgi:hypothetical protein